MRVPLEWLLEYCDPGLDVAGIEERLTMTGTKVEAIHHHGVMSPDGFVVGAVLSVEQHPNADRLRVCEVDLGAASLDGPAMIVCGAPNVAAGQRVAVALPGAVMPDGTKLKAAKLRGVSSAGMILAEDEIEIGPGHEGIMALDALAAAGALGPDPQIEPGTPLSQVLPIATEVIELEVTPNRPDCLGVYGVARELHAATGAPLAPEPWLEDPGTLSPLTGAEVEVLCPELCPRFTARIFEDVTIAASPPWLKARLSAAGQRPINNVVDITNYAMLLTGQPLHAFDLDRLAGARLTVRRARDGETVLTLDGEERTLDSEMILIEDEEGPTSIAGVMGGGRSEVYEGTTNVLMEVASWHGPSIHHASWGLGLRSEASSRFEKGLAPEQCMHAQAIAAQLMGALCGATLKPGTIDIGGAGPAPARIRLRSAKLRRILGVGVSLEREGEILRALDFEADLDGEDLQVSVPPLRRNDVTREADLIEEVARIDGLERLPASLPARRGAFGVLSETQRLRRRAVDALVGCGLYEVVGWTFTSPRELEELRLPANDPRRANAPLLENPLSEDQCLLRTMLLCSLRNIAAYNAARDIASLRLFEVGTVFAQDGRGRHAVDGVGVDLGDAERETGVIEHASLGVLMSGGVESPSWGERGRRSRSADFFALKAVLEALGDAVRVKLECRRAVEPFLHPGRGATVSAGEVQLGWIGELHPLLMGGPLAGAVAMELDLDGLLAVASKRERRYEDLISFPALRRDLAVSLPESVAAAAAIAAVRKAGGKLLADAQVFDVYTGPQVGAGRRSLALSLSFRAPDRTLSDEEIAPVRESILDALGEIGGELRG